MLRLPPASGFLDRLAGWAWRLIVVAVALGATIWLLRYVKVIVLPMLVAMTIAPALTPIVGALRGRGIRRPAPALALLTGLLVIAALVAVVAASIATQYDELAAAVNESVEEITDWFEGGPLDLTPGTSGDLNTSLEDIWARFSDYLVSGARTGISVITGLVLAVALLYFVLRDGPAFWRWILRRFSPEARPSIDAAGQRAWTVLGGYVRGTALIAAIDAVLIGVGLWIMDVPVAFSLAVLVFIGGFIPFIGATISGLIAVLVAFADAGWQTAVIVLGIVLGVQFIEGNFLQPIVQSRTVDLHPAVILLAVAAGGSLFGLLGAFLAVPVTAVLYAVVSSLSADLDTSDESEGISATVLPVKEQ